jgi:hypothetical protein
MIDIVLLSFFFSLGSLDTGKHDEQSLSCSLGWSDRHGFRGNESGSLQPIPVFCPRPNESSRHVQPLRSQQLRVTIEVTRTVTTQVICVFHASVTASSHFSKR